MSGSILHIIVKDIEKQGRGKIYFLSDFFDLGNYETIKKAFQRIEKQQILLRLARGIYLYPKIDKRLGLGVLYPSVEEVAKEIAQKDKAKIIPAGTYALNRLGFSSQVPANAVFLTDGTPRKINLNNGNSILFKRTTPGNLSYKNYALMLIVSGLKELKKKNIDDRIKNRIKDILINENKDALREDLKLAPLWIQEIILPLILI